MVEENVNSEELTEESSDEQKTYDADYVKKLKAEAKEYRTGKAALKKEYEETKARLDALEAEKLTDSEKKEKRVKELEAELEAIKGTARQKDIDNLILQSINGKNIVDVETAMLLIHKELSGEDEINDKVVTRIVENVIKAKPFLVNASAPDPSNGNFAKQNNEPQPNTEKMFGDFLRG